ncbi:MAG: GRRM system radical SAM/SPASM domain protein [Myxococcales bacterium]|nr:GRRM system radical SAM/SPASM domain protein [Myxococcales bacterium]
MHAPADIPSEPEATDWRARLELLVLQPTPFCNLDCAYCYLPNRKDTSRMSMATLDSVISTVATEGWASAQLSVIWHAGEPLVVGPAWYEEAFEIVAKRIPQSVAVRHHFQTNAVLLNASWCEFIKRHNVRVGVSVDGPAFLHDARRRTRDGKGTHAKVMRGVERLREASVDFNVICVLTRQSLAHPDDIFDFFSGLGAREIGFNVEEVEADNAASSLMDAGVEGEFRAFFRRIVERQQAATQPLRIREFEKVFAALRSPRFGHLRANMQNRAGHVLTVGWDGSFSTWSPELLGGVHPDLGSLALGTSLEGGLDARARARLAVFQDEIGRGIAKCERTCEYFSFCLGGVPANKLGEHGRFDGTETMFCRLTEKVMTDVLLDALDASLPKAG